MRNKNSLELNETNTIITPKCRHIEENIPFTSTKTQTRSNPRLLNKSMIQHYNTSDSFQKLDKIEKEQSTIFFHNKFDYDKKNFKIFESNAQLNDYNITNSFNNSNNSENSNTFSITILDDNHFKTSKNNLKTTKPFTNTYSVSHSLSTKIYTKTQYQDSISLSNKRHLQNIHELMGEQAIPLEEKHQHLPQHHNIDNDEDIQNLDNNLTKQMNSYLKRQGMESINLFRNNLSQRRPPSRELKKSIYD